MDTLLKADIFFVVTTVAVALMSIVFIIMMCVMIRAFNRLYKLFEKVQDNLDGASEDIKDMTTQIKESFLFNLVFFKKAKKKRS